MEYKELAPRAQVAALISKAMTHGKFKSEYELAQALGYERPSSIYSVKNGKRAISAGKLMKLIDLAGGSIMRMIAIPLTVGIMAMILTPSDALASPSNSLISLQKHCVLCQIKEVASKATIRGPVT